MYIILDDPGSDFPFDTTVWKCLESRLHTADPSYLYNGVLPRSEWPVRCCHPNAITNTACSDVNVLATPICERCDKFLLTDEQMRVVREF